MRTLITSKYQTTIPKFIRKAMKLSVGDAIEWKIEDGKMVIIPAKKNFLKFKNAITIGPGDIRRDIELARKSRSEKYQ